MFSELNAVVLTLNIYKFCSLRQLRYYTMHAYFSVVSFNHAQMLLVLRGGRVSDLIYGKILIDKFDRYRWALHS